MQIQVYLFICLTRLLRIGLISFNADSKQKFSTPK